MKKKLISLLLVPIFLLISCGKEDPEQKFNSLMEKAQKFKEEKKIEEARITIRQAIDVLPKNPKGYFELGEILTQQKNFGGAVENYQSALNLDPAHWDARLRIASLYLAAKQLEIAENSIVKLLEQNPNSIEAKVLNVGLLNAKGKKEKAREEIKKLYTENPENLVVITTLAYLNLADGKAKEAEELFIKALKQDQSNAAIRYSLADLYARQGRLDEAEELLTELVESNPAESALRYQFGEFLLRRGESEDAFKQYEETLKVNPLQYDARDRLYDMYLVKKEIDRAKQLTKELVQSNPNDPGVHYFQGRDAEVEGKIKEALDLYVKALTSITNFAPAYRRAGVLELKTGKNREGLEHLHQAIAINPNDVGARINLARDAFVKREFAAAKEHVNKVLYLFPRQLAANIIRADIALIEGDISTAREVYTILIKDYPQSTTGYIKMALLEEKEKNVEKALELYEKALAFDRRVALPLQRFVKLSVEKNGIDGTIARVAELGEKSKEAKPEYMLIQGSLVLASQGADKIERARKLFNNAIELNPNLFGAYYALAKLDSATGDAQQAIQNYKKLTEINPSHLPAKMLLGMLLEQTGSNQEAVEQYRAVLKLSPRFGPAANNLAWLLADKLQGDLDEALALAKVAKETMPEESSVADTLGWIYFKKGSHRAAIQYLREAYELARSVSTPESPVNPEIVYHLGEALAAAGEKENAKKVLGEALKAGGQQFPHAGRINQLLETLK